MGRAQIQPNPFPRFRCEGNASCGNPAEWVILTPGRAPGQIPICTADVNAIIESLPDALLPAVGALVRWHVLEGTTFGVDLWERFRAMHPGAPGTANEVTGGALAVTGGTGADPDPTAQLAAIEATVLQHVTEGTEWGLALVSKIADALPDEAAPDDDGKKAPEDATGTEEPPVHLEPWPACVCGWTPKPGSPNPEANLKAHQRFCEAAKAEKGAD